MNSSVAALDASIDHLLRLHDELGVPSVTVGVEQEARRQPHPWEIQLDNDLRALRTRLPADDADELRTFDIEPDVFGDRGRRGPAAANPLRAAARVTASTLSRRRSREGPGVARRTSPPA